MKTKNILSQGSENSNSYSSTCEFNALYHLTVLEVLNSIMEKGPETNEYVHTNEENFNQNFEIDPLEVNSEDSFTLVDELNILHNLMH